MDMDVDLELEIEISHRKRRLLLLHEFRLDRKATKATSNICSTMGKNILSVRTAQHCFHRFRNGNFELDDLPRTERSLQADMGLLKQLIEEDLSLTTRCIAERFGRSHTAVKSYLHKLSKTWKYGVWLLHELSILQSQHKVDACMKLFTLLKNILVG